MSPYDGCWHEQYRGSSSGGGGSSTGSRPPGKPIGAERSGTPATCQIRCAYRPCCALCMYVQAVGGGGGAASASSDSARRKVLCVLSALKEAIVITPVHTYLFLASGDSVAIDAIESTRMYSLTCIQLNVHDSPVYHLLFDDCTPGTNIHFQRFYEWSEGVMARS